MLFSEAADSFQGIPHSSHSSQVFIISSSFNEYSSTSCSLRYISICQKKQEHNNSSNVNLLAYNIKHMICQSNKEHYKWNFISGTDCTDSFLLIGRDINRGEGFMGLSIGSPQLGCI